MRANRVGTLRLEGEDAVFFIDSFFNPSAEDIAAHEARMNRINNSIFVRENNAGFEADIDGLDLSFLDEELVEEQLEVTVRVIVQITEDLFYSESGSELNQAKARAYISNTFSTCNVDDLLNIAA